MPRHQILLDSFTVILPLKYIHPPEIGRNSTRFLLIWTTLLTEEIQSACAFTLPRGTIHKELILPLKYMFTMPLPVEAIMLLARGESGGSAMFNLGVILTSGMLSLVTPVQDISIRSDDLMLHARGVTISGVRPRAVLLVERPYGEAMLIGLYSVSAPGPNGDATSNWIARQEIRSEGGAHETRWANMQSCPALYRSIEWLERIHPPTMKLFPSPPYPGQFSPPPILTPHADLYTLWGSGRGGDNAYVQVTLQASHGVIADWGATMRREIEFCWQVEEPIS